ncbi:hypothetical protein [Spiroplasma endosymbiont of Polydrusus pterygomalis]|uniref:hypothetical protein n=1 Tax=Spiroplasma endosymbiont of Polydrusus pterygomalis TaxID=3139327 RepID=UPI003CCAAA23
MKNSEQNQEIENLEKKIKTLRKRLNPFNENFSITDRETILQKITTISDEISKIKQESLDNNQKYPNQIENESLKFNDLEISTENQYENDATFLIPTGNIANDDIYNINSEEEIIKMQYGDKCCPCIIL